jgi:diaminopimelate decarboxylase
VSQPQNLVRQIVARNFACSGDELRIGEVVVSAIASRFGTPLFIYDESLLAEKAAALRRALPPRFDIHYSVKANPNPAILEFFLERGFGLEVASAGELYQSIIAGCAPSKIIFAGPGKSEHEIEYALVHRVGELHVESLTELDRVSRIANRLGVTARIGLRVNPSGDAEGGAMRMGGKPTQFGIDEEEIGTAVDAALALSAVSLQGIHIFAGTQILDAEIFGAQYRKGLEIARMVAKQIGRPLATLDFGGGLGIPYFGNDRELDLNAVAQLVTQLTEEAGVDPFLAGTRFVVEPGRYLVGEAGVYVAQVLDVKISRGKKFVILDGGMNHHLAASGNLGQTIKRNFPIAVLNRLNDPEVETVDIVGPLCTPLDTLARSIMVPKITIGDLIGIFQSGAYARSASPLGFLSHLPPPEVLVRGSEAIEIRSRGCLEELASSAKAPKV